MKLTVLFFGDVDGKIGRRAVSKILPSLKKQYSPDLVMANVENLAHGKGITEKTLQELLDAGVDFCTSGNHIFKREAGLNLLEKKSVPVIRPANYPDGTIGRGYEIIEVGTKKVLVINLLGKVFIDEKDIACPFHTLNDILEKHSQTDLAGIIVDIHAEATSEKVAIGWHADGKVSAVLGTHTHIPTADAKILPQGTAYITDVGMVGAVESVLGVKKDIILNRFLNNSKESFEFPEEGLTQVNAVVVEIDSGTRKAISVKLINKQITI
ncbi:TIGR00282 family metallophosphoesterase [Patescibacteria group bacterium]|nr:TIGR00282 family metallophosphoesterase [Patescibacteria group bacterium]